MSEVIIFIQTCFIVITSLAYSFTIGKIIKNKKIRSLFISPIITLFLLLPLLFTSVTLCATTALLFSWLATFKLALFSINKGPLATEYPTITFSRFLALGSLPIIISTQPKLSSKIDHNDPKMKLSKVFALKVIIFTLLYKFIIKFKDQLHQSVVFSINGILLCLSLDFITVYAFQALLELILGLELEPLFNNPLLSTSVQNFWGRRWNLAMSNILRESVYKPVREMLTPNVGTRHAQRLGVLATFGVSAIMHEIVLYYLSRKKPSWEMTWYFLMNGIVVVVEMDVKRKLVGKKTWMLPRFVSTLLTFGFLTISGMVMISPQIYHCNCDVRLADDVKAFEDVVWKLRRGVTSFRVHVTDV